MDKEIPFTIEDVPIPFGERLTTAVQYFFHTLVLIPIYLVLAPVGFFRILFTKTKPTVVLFGQGNAQLNGGPLPPSANGDDGEDWKRQHREMYGDDE